MEHDGFYERAGPFDLSEVAERVGARCADVDRLSGQLFDIRTLDCAGARDLSFFDNRKYLSQLQSTGAGACLVSPKEVDHVPDQTIALVTPEPYRAFARALFLFYPDAGRPLVYGGVEAVVESPTKAPPIHPSAELEEGVRVEPGAIIAAEARVGRGTRVAAGAVIGYRVHIGRDCFVGPNATVIHSLVGDRVILHAGVRLGQDGFGFAMGPEGHFKVPQIGRVVIQDDVEIGANSAVDRGALADTFVGEGSKIDNLVQIGHNVRIGRHCVVAGLAGIAGSTTLEDFVAVGGHVAVAGHLTIGTGTQVAGGSGIASSTEPGATIGGYPARPFRQWAREIAALKKLAARRVKD